MVPEQMAVVTTTGSRPILSAPPPIASASEETPASVTPAVGARGCLGSGDPLHYATLLMPPSSITPGSMITPDPTELFIPVTKKITHKNVMFVSAI
jgi:hypothetical protein